MMTSSFVSNEKNILQKAVTIWLCTAFFYLYQFVIRVSPQAIVNDMMCSLGMDACVLGGVISLYYYGYSSMQIPAGLVLDRVGVRRPLFLCCLMCAAGALIFATSKDIFFLSFGRLLMGVGSAFGFLSNVKVASLWFAPRRLPLVIGLTLMMGTIGAATAGKPLAHMVAALGWQKAMFSIAFGGILMAIAAWLLIEDRQHSVFAENEPPKDISGMSMQEVIKDLFESLYAIISKPRTWLLGAYGLFMYFPLAGFGDLWGASYLESVYGMDRITANAVVTAFYFGVGLGSPCWPWVLSYTRSYQLSMLLSALLTGAFFGSFIFLPNMGVAITAILLFLTGAAAGGQFLAFSAVAEINDPSRTGTASGVHNMLCMISGVIVQPLFGFVLDRNVQIDPITKARIYPPEAYIDGLTAILAVIGLAIVCTLFIRGIKYLHAKPR